MGLPQEQVGDCYYGSCLKRVTPAFLLTRVPGPVGSNFEPKNNAKIRDGRNFTLFLNLNLVLLFAYLHKHSS